PAAGAAATASRPSTPGWTDRRSKHDPLQGSPPVAAVGTHPHLRCRPHRLLGNPHTHHKRADRPWRTHRVRGDRRGLLRPEGEAMSFYAVASSDNPHQWHDARSKVVTATDLSRLAHGGPAVWNTIKAEKAGHRQNISNAYIAHGVEREPVIARWAADELGLEHNTSLLVHADDERFGATPDLLSPDNSVVADIKTAKAPEWVEPPAHYVDQVLAQMFVTGAQSGYIIAEFHQDFIPTAMEPTVYVVERDDDRIDFLLR